MGATNFSRRTLHKGGIVPEEFWLWGDVMNGDTPGLNLHHLLMRVRQDPSGLSTAAASLGHRRSNASSSSPSPTTSLVLPRLADTAHVDPMRYLKIPFLFPSSLTFPSAPASSPRLPASSPKSSSVPRRICPRTGPSILIRPW